MYLQKDLSYKGQQGNFILVHDVAKRKIVMVVSPIYEKVKQAGAKIALQRIHVPSANNQVRHSVVFPVTLVR